ncbi:homeobox-leucine zipper protein ROC3-like [Setaria italica]|uniref:homeobox-leucine zipper protein ROC3-like n=1 Tax=Setaria italica TaxID=4555 RepID=UPI000350C59D|nr:homeobox-leucine zipper protein ROC3-like [Setaria italica]
MFGDCQVLSSMAAMAGASSSADALFIPNPGALAGFMSSSAAAMPFHHFSTTTASLILPKEEGGMMGALQAAKDEDMELEMDMELSGGSGSGHLDGLLSFADVDDDRPEQKPQHGGLVQYWNPHGTHVRPVLERAYPSRAPMHLSKNGAYWFSL